MSEATQTVAALISDLDTSEIWRPVSDFPTYEISSWGQVRRNGRILQPGINLGYHIISLSDRLVKKTARVHRLVAFAFLGPALFDGAIVAHNDGDRLNNRVSNLRWASALENSADAIRHDTRTKGSEVHNAKLCEEQIPVIRQKIADGKRYPEIADEFGVSISTISLIKKNRIWAHV